MPTTVDTLALAHQQHQAGNLGEAERLCRLVVQAEPDNAEALQLLAVVYLSLRRWDEASGCCRQALVLAPDCPEAHNNLGMALAGQGQLDESAACFRHALHLRPDYATATMNLGNVLKESGLLDEALAAYRRGIELCPEASAYHSSLLYTLHFHPASDAAVLGAEHQRWYARHASPLAKLTKGHANDPDPERRLRVGYVSADFRYHPVGLFLVPLFEAHDHQGCEIFCYSSVAAVDDVTARLRRHADRWRDVAGLSDEQLAEQVRADGVDILVDLTAHTANNRLLTFARKPAPVQATYLAYCSTTGLHAMDYRLTDPFLDPPGQQASYYAEKSVWLPHTYWCYRPYLNVGAVAALPAGAAGPVTFGCLNNFCKETPPALAAWRDLLLAAPGARLLLHAHPGVHRERVRGFFAGGAIDPARIDFVDRVLLADYFRLYDRIDIGLDPFPYTGGTTTCDALWMGVPVVSLAGATAVGRGGLSILSNVGLPELAARTPAEYVAIAAGLAADRPRLAALRSSLRLRMLCSPLMDAPRFARNLEAAFRAMWRQWCARRQGEE